MNADPAIERPSMIDPLADPPEVRSFNDWYREDYRPVVGLVFSLTGNRAAAEELTQDAFVEAHKRWGTLSAYDDPGAWVRKVALNKAKSGFRRRAAEARAYARHVGRRQPAAAALPEGADQFWAAVRTLPAQQAQVVALHYLEDLPVDRIADVLEIAPGTVKTHLHRARAALAERLTPEDLS